MFDDLQFSLAETLSLLGLAQCVYVLVYMLFRSGSIASAIIPSLFFSIMATAFFADFASFRLAGLWGGYEETIQWGVWFCCLPVGALLALQIAHIRENIPLRYFFLLLVIPVTLLAGYISHNREAFYVTGLVTGALSLLTVWVRRDLLDGLYVSSKFGRERFWLIMGLVGLGAAFLLFTFAHMNESIDSRQWLLVRTFLGIAFAYVAGTSLFRIYPQILKKEGAQDVNAQLSADEHMLLQKLKELLDHEKIYQDPTIGRAELAREVGVSESSLSRIVNIAHAKSIPQLLNDLRVEDAQKLLRETDVTIQNVFEESGFNSVTTFNRVFKEICGETPKEYRARYRA